MYNLFNLVIWKDINGTLLDFWRMFVDHVRDMWIHI